MFPTPPNKNPQVEMKFCIDYKKYMKFKTMFYFLPKLKCIC